MKFLKKSLFILTISLSFILNAQDHNTTPSSKAGLKFGYNLAAVSFDGDTETGQRHSFHAGFYGESFLAQAIALQIEFLYSQQGYELQDSSGTFTQKLDYINLPLSLKLYPTKSFFLEAGPQVGYAISHKEEFEGTFFETSQEFEPNNFDWGVNFGGGFKSDSGVSLSVRYHLGMGDIYDEGNPQNRVWQISLGFDF
ncbi:porin family protein [Algibacter pectinivorans]|uniref:Outer membrane protein beta-barrel domain-containing protein n=1 Tax=Algibacter pectinivorans TaxID=870482 RepID=A0A1I1M8J2_9FLAO|nr:porin family protein [Algibacter pectinivorans]SFC81082.1 Outer membrane protein beta-barrel domain-containing protein [Algibacter pectinivorans]